MCLVFSALVEILKNVHLLHSFIFAQSKVNFLYEADVAMLKMKCYKWKRVHLSFYICIRTLLPLEYILNSILFPFYAMTRNITNNKYHKNSSYVLSLYTFMTPRSIIHMVQLMLLKTERNAECDNETVVINIYFRFHTLVHLLYVIRQSFISI